MLRFIFAGVFLLYLYPCLSQDSTEYVRKTYETKMLDIGSQINIDGKSDESFWQDVEWTGDFTQRDPNPGQAPTEETRFKFLCDEKYIYFFAECLDSQPEDIEMRLSRRDGYEGDWLELNIDSYHDLQTAFAFNITAAGVRGDAIITRDGENWDSSWNPIWEAEVTRDAKGWYAEMKIPLNQLRFSEDNNQVWGIQLTRKLFRKNERSIWQYIPVDDPRWVSGFGELEGVKGIKNLRQVELAPYVVMQKSNQNLNTSNGLAFGDKSQAVIGLDGKIGITNDLSLDFTINPDFGQVEADPAAITLDGFQIFFEERRPFFVEGKNIYDYGLSRSAAGNTFGNDNLFYSRRIGRSPSFNPQLTTGEISMQPTNTTILGAAKLTGKTKKGWSIGIMESVTGNEFANISLGDETRKELIEPMTNYFVTRLKKDFNERNSSIGGIITSTLRNPVDHLSFLHNTATSASLDFDHRWKDRTWAFSGNIAMSHVTGTTDAILGTQQSIQHLFQRVDADHLAIDTSKTSMTGMGGHLKVGKFGNSFMFESGIAWRTPGLELNDIGFQRQADDLRHFTWAGYRKREPFSIFNSAGINYNHWLAYDFGGNMSEAAVNINGFVQFKNTWSAGTGTNMVPFLYNYAELRGGPRMRQAAKHSNWFWVESDSRKKVRFNFNYFLERGKEKAIKMDGFNFGVTFRPSNALEIRLSPNYRKLNNKLQYVTQLNYNGNQEYIMATIDQENLGIGLRLNYTLGPDLSIQYYGEPFAAKGSYQDFKRVTDSYSANYHDKFTSLDTKFIDEIDQYNVDQSGNGLTDYTIYNPDFVYIQFRSNLVLRWEYNPGSELFLVWNLGNTGSNDNNENFGTLFNDHFSNAPMEHRFLMKMTYRFGL